MLRLAFRSCFRNTRRTVITAFSVFIASLIVIIVMAFMITIVGDMAENEKLYYLGDIRIRNEVYTRYESLMPVRFHIDNLSDTVNTVLSVPGVGSVVALSSVYASVYRDGKTKSASVIGASENSVFFSEDAVLNEGRMPERGKKEAVATLRFLTEEGLSVGDEVTLLFKTVSSGSNALRVKITGCVSYLNAEYNSSLVLMNIETLNSVLHMENGALEMLVYLEDGGDEEDVVSALEEKLDGRGLEVKTYESLSTVAAMKVFYDVMLYSVIILFFFIASTLVFNTMMMSVLERKKEIATFVALGFSRLSVILTFVIEGVIIAFIGSAAAAAAGRILISYFHHAGIDLALFGADAVEGWSFPSILYPYLGWGSYVLVSAVETAVAAAAAFLASVKIRKMEVAEELREET